METYDAIVIGAGPAGCSAALYAARASLSVLVLEHGVAGGQIATTDAVDNYPGIPEVSGAELGERLRDHAAATGARFAYGSVSELVQDAVGCFSIATDDGRYRARSVIAALGATPRRAGFSGEDEFRGRGVSYCATCDAPFYRGKRVFVIGGGTTACEEAVYLARFAQTVELVVRRDRFRAPRGVVERMLRVENIKVRYLTSIVELTGKRLPERIVFRDNASGAMHEERFEAGSFGVFVLAGTDPATELLEPFVELGPDGGVITDESMATKTPGLFCAGDVRSKPVRQVVTAASDGAIAASSAYRYVEEHFRSA